MANGHGSGLQNSGITAAIQGSRAATIGWEERSPLEVLIVMVGFTYSSETIKSQLYIAWRWT